MNRLPNDLMKTIGEFSASTYDIKVEIELNTENGWLWKTYRNEADNDEFPLTLEDIDVGDGYYNQLQGAVGIIRLHGAPRSLVRRCHQLIYLHEHDMLDMNITRNYNINVQGLEGDPMPIRLPGIDTDRFNPNFFHIYFIVYIINGKVCTFKTKSNRWYTSS